MWSVVVVVQAMTGSTEQSDATTEPHAEKAVENGGFSQPKTVAAPAPQHSKIDQISTSKSTPKMTSVDTPSTQPKLDELDTDSHPKTGTQLSKSQIDTASAAAATQQNTQSKAEIEQAKKSVAIALGTYTAKKPDQLNLIKKDMYTVLQNDKNWWLVRNSAGEEGSFVCYMGEAFPGPFQDEPFGFWQVDNLTLHT